MYFKCESCGAEFDVGKFDIENFRCPYCNGGNAIGKATAVPKSQISTNHPVFRDSRFSVGIKDEMNADEQMPPQEKRYGRKKRSKYFKSYQKEE